MKSVAWLTLLILGCPGPQETSEPIGYTVVRGDTLFLIAKRHGTTVEAIQDANQLQGDLIEVNQVLVLPADATQSARKPPQRRPMKRSERTERTQRPSLRMPSPKPCVRGPEAVHEEHAMAASEGIPYGQARDALRTHAPHALRCFEEQNDVRQGTLTLELHVACTGLVTAVEILETPDWPHAITMCIADAMAYADFPAHALPDGDVLVYPLTYTPPSP